MEQLGRGHPLEVLNVKGNEIEGLDMLLYLRGCEVRPQPYCQSVTHKIAAYVIYQYNLFILVVIEAFDAWRGRI